MIDGGAVAGPDQKLISLPFNCSNATACCLCPNCHYETVVPTIQSSGDLWLGYNYNGMNNLKIILSYDAIALSKVKLIFSAIDATPIIQELKPSSLAVDSVGPLVIIGEIKINWFLYVCQWMDSTGANFSVIANQDQTNQYTCTIPDSMAPGMSSFWFFANVSVIGNAIASAGPIPFMLYKEPVIKALIPRVADPAGGVFIMIHGTSFFNSSSLNCKFGNLLCEAHWYNSSVVSCLVPPAGKGQFVVPVSITENGMDFTNEVLFSYSHPWTPVPRPPKFSFFWIMIVIVVCFILIMLVIGGYVIYQIKKQQSKYDLTQNGQIEGLGSAAIRMSELTLKERIGRGSFGVVYRGYWRYTEVAVKQIPITPEVSLEGLMGEAKLMANLRHPNVTVLMGLCLSVPDICIITEFISRGSLYAILHADPPVTFEPEHIRKLALDTCKGMAYIHGAKIIHRDLKCSNILVDKNWNAKVSDFGLSRFVSDTNNTMTACGTPSWAAPEVLRNMSYSFKADVYSFGVCLWEMATQKYPYDGQPPYQIVIQVATQGLRPELPDSILGEFRQLITQCWDEDPSNRPTFGDLVLYLEQLELPKPSTTYPKYKKSMKTIKLTSFSSEIGSPTPHTALLPQNENRSTVHLENS